MLGWFIKEAFFEGTAQTLIWVYDFRLRVSSRCCLLNIFFRYKVFTIPLTENTYCFLNSFFKMI